jgi:acyl dehydratase
VGTTALTSPPSLGPLYAKAGLLGQLHRGDSLPDSVYTLSDQRVDADHADYLVAYQKVCGFRVTDELPATYLHLLAFPVSVALMTESAFPFPLIGMVHVANSITVTRAVHSAETFSFTVRAANLRPHPAGRQLDLLAEATVDGETVWSSRSTYLRRGGAPKDAASGDRAAKPERGERSGPSGQVSVVRVPDDIGRRYAAISGDRNPIHLYALTAKLFGFPAAIAHGMWLKARTLAALEGRLPDSFTAEVAFKTPVLLPSTIGIAAEQVGTGWVLDVRNVANGKPHLTGTVA